MNRHEVFIKRWPKPLKFNYYKSIMPDVAITLCQSCNRVSRGNCNFYYFEFKTNHANMTWGILLTASYELLKTGLSNVVLPILLIVVNNIEQVVEPESSPQSGVTMLNNIVDIIEQCGQHNIVQSCFQQPVTTYNFWLCRAQFIF